MSRIIQIVILASILSIVAQAVATGTFCSAVCKPNSCSGPLPTDCSTSCDTNFMASSGTCVVNPSSGWTQIDTSTDLGGTGYLDSGSITTCGPQVPQNTHTYSYFGNFTKTDTVTLTFANGITSPYYQIQLIYWLIYVDQVDSGVQISTTLNEAPLTVLKSRSTSRVTMQGACGNNNNN
jgi:hypothetical protein